MEISEKIMEFLKTHRNIENANISQIKMTSSQNKMGNNLLFIRTSVFEKPVGNCYSSNSTYYAFDMQGNFVGCVMVRLLNVILPSQVEMEYWVNEQYENQGNITVLAKEVIKEIFDDKVFDNLKVRENNPLSSIDSIMVDINDDNIASLSVAKKLGFDENGFLNINDYCRKAKM